MKHSNFNLATSHLSRFFAGSHKNNNDSIEIKEGQLCFLGGCRYESIPLESIESISYVPRDDIWQEVGIKMEKQNTFNYYLSSDAEVLKKAVDKVSHELEPLQPICKFILSAKQGSLSGKD